MSQIFLTVDKSNVALNEKLRGKILLSLTEEATDLKTLCLQIVGKEIHFRRHFVENGQGKGKELLSTKTFLEFSYPVFEFPANQTLPGGNHEFPFEFQFPQGLPVSMKLTSPATDEIFSVSYLISAQFLNQPAPSASLEVWLSQGTETTSAVSQRIPRWWSEYSAPSELAFTSFCCSSGCVRLALQLPRIIVAGKPFDLFYSIQNLTSFADLEVEFALWAELRPKTRMTTLQSVELVKLFKTKKIPSSQLHVSSESARAFSTVKGVEASDVRDTTVLSEMKTGLNQPDNLLRIVLPEKYALPGHVIAFGHKGVKEVSYHVTFQLSVGGKTMKVRAPIDLIQSSGHKSSVTSAPPLSVISSPLPDTWSESPPTSHDTVSLPLPSYSEPAEAFTSTDFHCHDVSGAERNISIDPTSTLSPITRLSEKVSAVTYDGFVDLIYALKTSFQQHATFLAWLTYSEANVREIEECTEHDFTMLFQGIRRGVDQLLIAEDVIRVKTDVTIQHILAALAVSATSNVKVGLAQILATRYVFKESDRNEVIALQRQCTAYEYLCIEDFFADRRGAGKAEAAYNNKKEGKGVVSNSYDTVQSRDDVALTVGVESTEDGMQILRTQSASLSPSLSGSKDVAEEEDRLMHQPHGIEVSRM
eukprot:gene6004-6453_t